MVDCSFITEFEDHIFVTIDAEAFFFLHDLISSYLKEKEKVVGKAISSLLSFSAKFSHIVISSAFFSRLFLLRDLGVTVPTPRKKGTPSSSRTKKKEKNLLKAVTFSLKIGGRITAKPGTWNPKSSK